MDDVVSITLLRHGLTNENKQKKYLGWTDSSVNEEGKRQLYELKDRNYIKPDLVVTSDLKRCIETAEILFPESMYITSTSFREYHFGLWDTKDYDQLKNDPLYRSWIDEPFSYTPPKGEPFAQFKARVLTGYQDLVGKFSEQNIENITLITHGGPMRLLLSEFAPYEKPFWEWEANYGQGYILKGDRTEMRRMSRCTLLQVAPLTGN